jgi:hypothetical protein
VKAGGRFQVVQTAVDLQPSGCNQGYGRGTVRSTAPSVLAYQGNGDNVYWSVFAGSTPGEATLEAIDLPTPSGGRQTVPLTVCSQPGAAELTCSSRVSLSIRVVP